MWKRIRVQPGVVGGRLRQCTAAFGTTVVYGPEAFEYEARLEGVPLADNCWCIARALAVGRIRSEYEAIGEGGRSRTSRRDGQSRREPTSRADEEPSRGSRVDEESCRRAAEKRAKQMSRAELPNRRTEPSR